MAEEASPGRRRPRRSVGTARAFRLFGNIAPEALASDLAAVDEGIALRIACVFRATYGRYPRRFAAHMADLSVDGIVVRPYWYSLDRRVFRVTEEIIEAHVRPRNARTDWNIRATGSYSANGSLAHIGMEVITCRTSLGIIELAVVRPDVPLVLHYLKSHAKTPNNNIDHALLTDGWIPVARDQDWKVVSHE